jgi:hypothetical protein
VAGVPRRGAVAARAHVCANRRPRQRRGRRGRARRRRERRRARRAAAQRVVVAAAAGRQGALGLAYSAPFNLRLFAKMHHVSQQPLNVNPTVRMRPTHGTGAPSALTLSTFLGPFSQPARDESACTTCCARSRHVVWAAHWRLNSQHTCVCAWRAMGRPAELGFVPPGRRAGMRCRPAATPSSALAARPGGSTADSCCGLSRVRRPCATCCARCWPRSRRCTPPTPPTATSSRRTCWCRPHPELPWPRQSRRACCSTIL